MIEKIVNWIFPLKSGFGMSYGNSPKVSGNFGLGIGIQGVP